MGLGPIDPNLFVDHIGQEVGIWDVSVGTKHPDDIWIGSTPQASAKHFTKTEERLVAYGRVPREFRGGSDIKFRIYVALTQQETDGDTLDLEYDYVIVNPKTVGVSGENDKVSKVSTAGTAQLTVTTARGLAPDTLYEFSTLLTETDANNPVGMNRLIYMEFGMANTTGVAEFGFLAAYWEYF